MLTLTHAPVFGVFLFSAAEQAGAQEPVADVKAVSVLQFRG